MTYDPRNGARQFAPRFYCPNNALPVCCIPVDSTNSYASPLPDPAECRRAECAAYWRRVHRRVREMEQRQ